MRMKMIFSRTNAAEGSKRIASVAILAVIALTIASSAQSQERSTTGKTGTIEQIVLFRHGEKPQPEGFGQLSCKGLNRALSLPSALARYGTPTLLFAPDPAVPFYPDVSNPATPASGRFSYVRPLVTIDALAIALPSLSNRSPLPVNTQYAYYKADELATALLQPDMSRSNVFIAWEHVNLTTIAKDIMQRFSVTSGRVPDVWDDDDYDSVYVITIDRKSGADVTARFAHACEGMGDGGRACPLAAGHEELSSTCPGPALATQANERH